MRFPLFVDLTGRNAVVIGGGRVGCRRAEVLRRFGAVVTIVSPTLRIGLEDVRHIPRAYQEGDLAGAYLAVAATSDAGVNSAAGQEARRLGILFNRADAPDQCDFFFPAVCEGSGIVAGVAGDGSDHAAVAQAAQRIRKVLSPNINMQ